MATFKQNTSAPLEAWGSISISSTGQYQLAGSNFGAYTSNDNGKTWNLVAIIGNQEIWDVAINKSGQYQAIIPYDSSDTVIYISNNYGVTFTKVVLFAGFANRIGEIGISGNGQYIIAAVETSPTSGGVMFLSSNYGLTFTQDNILNYVGNTALSFNGQYRTYIGGGLGKIYTSNNFGAFPLTQNPLPVPTGGFGAVSMSDNGQYQVVIHSEYYVYSTIYVSNNFGITFNTINIGFVGQNWYGISVGGSGQYQSACGSQFGIFQSDDYGNTWKYNTSSNKGNNLWYDIAQSDEGYVTSAVQGESYGIQNGGYIYNAYSNENNYFILDSPIDISLTEINVPGVGTYSSVICLSNNSITFTDKCLGLSAECLLIATGAPGLPGWGDLSTFPANGAGSGGGGGGHLYGNLRITNSSGSFPYNNTYDISISRVSQSILNDPSWNGTSIGIQPTSLGHNDLYIFPSTLNGLGLLTNGGNLRTGGPLYTLGGGTGGNGGQKAIDGSNADIGNSGLSGKYIFNQVGNIYVGGGGGGGGGNTSNPTPEGYGGNAGYLGIGGVKGLAGGDGSGDSNGGDASYNYSNAGAGGGGGGIPLDQTAFSDKGNPSQGLFFLQVFDPEPPTITSLENDYIFLSSNYDASVSQVYVPGMGTYATAVCLSNNQITFKPHAMCCSANLLIVGGGGGGFMGEVQQPGGSPFFNIDGLAGGFGGGGGGGAAHFFGTVDITASSGIFPYNQTYDISVATGGMGGFIYPSTSVTDGNTTYFGGNYFNAGNTPYASGGNGGGAGTLIDPISGRGLPGSEGNTVAAGIFSQIPPAANNGGNGGYGATVYNAVGPPSVPVLTSQNGINAGNGNTGNPGEYLIPTYGTIFVGGGGAGGDVSANAPVAPSVNWEALPGKGGNAGNGIGGLGFGPGGNSGNGFSDSIGKFALHNFYSAGGGGGGGGAPYYDISYLSTNGIATAMGGDGAGGMFLIQVFDPLPPPPLPLLPNPPPPPPAIPSPLTTDLFYFNIADYAFTQQITLPNNDILAFGICLSNNSIVFTTQSQGSEATMLLVGGGGGGGGGYNSKFPGAGGGGGGGGILYGKSIINSGSGSLPINIPIDISLGIGGIPGRGPYEGTSGGVSVFGANYYGYNSAPKVSGGGPGGATVDNSCNGGITGTVLTYGPFVSAGGAANGGAGGDGYKCWTNVVAATDGAPLTTFSYNFPNYGIVVAGGGGGGGGGAGGPFCIANITAGFGGDAGLGTGGNAGVAGGDGINDSKGRDALFDYFNAGAGGGGAGLPEYNELQYDVSGGYGGGGLFAIMVVKPYVPPPPSPCPCPVFYKPLVTGDNNPQTFPGYRYSQYVRSSLGRPGYQRPAYGDRTLSPFGYWQGAPSGYGKPPQNSFV